MRKRQPQGFDRKQDDSEQQQNLPPTIGTAGRSRSGGSGGSASAAGHDRVRPNEMSSHSSLSAVLPLVLKGTRPPLATFATDGGQSVS